MFYEFVGGPKDGFVLVDTGVPNEVVYIPVANALNLSLANVEPLSTIDVLAYKLKGKKYYFQGHR